MQNPAFLYLGAYLALGIIYLLFAWAAVSFLELRGVKLVEQEEQAILDAGLPFTPTRAADAERDHPAASELMDGLSEQRKKTLLTGRTRFKPRHRT